MKIDLEQRQAIIPYALIVLLTAAAFAPSLTNPFLFGDDYFFIVDNPNINIPLNEIPSLFTMSLWKSAGTEYRQAYYRPVVSTLFILDHRLWGLNVIGYHLSNILFHVLAAMVLYRTGTFLFSDKTVSLAGACIFAVHPVNYESVGRAASGEAIFGLFVILSLFFFLSGKHWLSWAAFSLALLSKESAVMFPVALTVLSLQRNGPRKGLVMMAPYVVLTALYLGVRALVLDTVFGGGIGAAQPVTVRVYTMAVAVMDYIRLLVVPYPLNPYYPARWYVSLSEPKVAAALLILGALCLLVYRLRKNKVMLFLAAFAVIMLAPVIWHVNAFSYGSEFAYINEKYLYVSAMPFSLLAAAVMVTLAGNRFRKLLMPGLMFVVLVFVAGTINAIRTCESSISYFRTIINKFPNTVFAHADLGKFYLNQGNADEAIKELRTASKLNPFDPDVHAALGLAWSVQGDADSAIRELKFALTLDPKNTEALFGLGNVYFSLGRFHEAAVEYRKTLEVKPGHVKALNNLGTVYANLGDFDSAIEHYRAVIKIEPDLPDTRNNLGMAYARKGRTTEAVQEFEAALRLKPDFEPARLNLAAIRK